ncbi:MAG: CoA transferase [Desulfobulbaceae bacterium]|nr:CoA transferase [Desulfobulbaceae bacterium]
MKHRGALEGIRVLDLSRMLPGPYCSMILADHGAEVIGIEARKFQEDDLFFNDLNRNKRHITLNLKNPQGLEIFLKLADKADVILEGFRPGVVTRLGVDYQTIKKRNPKIIYCSITGYGQTGPLRDRPGHDVNYLSIAGVLDLIGEKGRPNVIPGVQIADVAGGAMNAAVGILLALYARDRTGKGQYIDISMTDGILGLLSLPNHFFNTSGKYPKAADGLLSHRYACYNTYETSDGRYVALGAVENRFWQRFCEYLNRPDLTPLQYDDEKRDEIISYLRQVFLTKTFTLWESELAALDICYSGVQTMEEVMANPLFRQREMVVDCIDESGDKKSTIGIPVKLNETPGSIRTPPSQFGEDTRAVLKETGYSEEEIKCFYEDGAV